MRSHFSWPLPFPPFPSMPLGGCKSSLVPILPAPDSHPCVIRTFGVRAALLPTSWTLCGSLTLFWASVGLPGWAGVRGC